MNEYNHHRIIERLVFHKSEKKDTSIKKIFIEASDFSDSIGAKENYFFYRNYYSIKTENNKIQLNRVGTNGYVKSSSIQNMKKTGEKLPKDKYFLGDDWSRWTDEKEFFSAVNDRRKSIHYDLFDTGNQSDNVAFLHAMGAEGEAENESRSIFENHLRTCFAEYLFLEKEDDALFMLGVAFHGIMDSFTPSHMGFQKYQEQDMALHAQGDVIPIMGEFENGNFLKEEQVDFDYGQYTKEGVITKKFDTLYKYYDEDGIGVENPIVYKMLRIFLYISDIQMTNGEEWIGVDVEKLWTSFSGNYIKRIKDILGNADIYRYGPKSYAYSEAAIKVISDIYYFLSKKREKCKDYLEYKTNKQTIVEDALQKWKSVYDGNIEYSFNHKTVSFSMKNIRDGHLRMSLYSKDSDLENWKMDKIADRMKKKYALYYE